jgi:Predicted phosphohydrolases
VNDSQNGFLRLAARLGPPALAGLTASATAGYTLLVEPYRLEVTRPRLVAPRLPEALEGLRVLLLADPHIARWGRREDLLMQHLGALPEAPDLIIWGGDYIYQRDGMDDALRLAERVRALFPTVPAFGVLGNAEHKLNRTRRARFAANLEGKAGIVLLNNRQAPLTLRDETITIAGVDDPYYGHDDLAEALAPVPPCRRFTLLLAHSPQIVARAARAGVDVMLSGHTHGGQIRLPLVGALKTQNPLGRRMDQGAFDRARLTGVLGRDPGGDLTLYITRGIGSAPIWRFRGVNPRLLCRPEITLLTLHRNP